jgi:hypothetical protein
VEYPILTLSYGEAPEQYSKKPADFSGNEEENENDEEEDDFNFDELIDH